VVNAFISENARPWVANRDARAKGVKIHRHTHTHTHTYKTKLSHKSIYAKIFQNVIDKMLYNCKNGRWTLASIGRNEVVNEFPIVHSGRTDSGRVPTQIWYADGKNVISML
jgi:hypothetical protein